MGVARGKSGGGIFPKGRRPRAGCGAEPHVAAQAKIFLGVFLILKNFVIKVCDKSCYDITYKSYLMVFNCLCLQHSLIFH